MNKKTFFAITILLIAFTSIGWRGQAQDKSILKERFQEFKQEFKEKRTQGYDVSEAENLIRQAKEAHQKGNKKEARRLLKYAFGVLENAQRIAEVEKTRTSAMPKTAEKKTNKRLSQVRIASLYERVTDGAVIGRSLDDVINLLKETKTDFIFRGFWRWVPVPESPDEVSSALLELAKDRKIDLKNMSDYIKGSGWHYKQLKETIAGIKKELSHVIFCGAIPAQKICRVEQNPITGKIYGDKDTWKMALDPQKWKVKRNGRTVSKEEFQKWFGKTHQWVKENEAYNWQKVPAYFPDITNPDYQKLLLSWAKKQINCGADAIWIDMLHTQAMRMALITKDINHPAVRESMEASSKIVDEIHNYGTSRGTYIYVGSWDGPFGRVDKFPYLPPTLDFVTVSPSGKEIFNKKLDETKWDYRIANIRKVFGNTPIFSFIDWSHDKSPLVTFSQELRSEEQTKMLEILDEFFAEREVSFVYPIHGGYMGRGEITTKLAFGKYRVYDSLASEFQTYETIKELALKKSYASVKSTSSDDNWLYEGQIYETHPYYYPNHSFKEITRQIPHLAELGVKTIYLMPIWEHEPLPPEGSHYRYGFAYHILDYHSISPEFGTEKQLKELVDTVHENNMKIIFDLVTCCTFEGSKTYNWGLTISLSELTDMDLKLEYTPDRKYVYSNCRNGNMSGMYENMIECDLFGRIVGNEVKLYTYPYPGFGHAIDKTNTEVISYFTEVAEYYVREYNIDGWRIDAPVNIWNPEIISGDHSATKLLRSAKKAVLKVKPNAIFYSESPSIIPIHLSENLPDPVLDEMCEASYSYYFSSNIADHKTSELLVKFLSDETIWHDRTRTRFVETHDTSRINDNVSQLNKPSLVLISTIPGVPMIQAGQEVGATNPFLSDASVDWANGDYELGDFYKKVFEIRNNNNALKYGTIENVWKSGDNTYAYSRTYEDKNVVVIINFNNKQATSALNIPFKAGDTLKDELSGETFTVTAPDNFRVSIPSYGSKILTLE